MKTRIATLFLLVAALSAAPAVRGSLPTPFGPTSLHVEVRFEDGIEVHDYFVPAPAGGGETRMLELRYRHPSGEGSAGVGRISHRA